ncbi:MAG: UbiA family prenyltransferase [Archaeoglobaceae archaeon]
MHSLKRSLKATWELLRLEHGLMYGLAVLIGVLLSKTDFDLEKAFLGFFVAVFLQASAFAMNDYLDYEVDIANKRTDRPLVRGEIDKKTALALSIAFFPLGIFLAFLISINALLFALAVVFFGYLYNLKLKELGFPGNVYIAFTMAAPFIFGGIISKMNESVLILALIAFLSGLGREIMKGIEDVEGDALRNVKSIARVYGIKSAAKLAAILFVLSVFLSFLPPLLIPEYLDVKYILPVLFTDFVLISVIFRVQKSPEKVSRYRKDTLFAMLIGLIAFLAGAF